MNNAFWVITTALCSGLIATVITLLWQEKNRKKLERVQIFKTLMSKRYDIASEESVEALNMIDVAFYSSSKVRKAWKEFVDATNLPELPTRSQTINDKHLRLLEVIAEDIGYGRVKWEDIKHYYYPIGLSNKLQDETVLRKVQIDAGIAQIAESKKNPDSSQTASRTELANQLLLKAIENPDGLLKLMDVAEKAQGLSKGTSKRI